MLKALFLAASFASQSKLGRRSARAGWSVAARLRCFVHAARGLRWMMRHEANARVHLVLTAAAVVGAALLRVSLADWRWIFLAIALVWAAEALNTALEKLCDRVSPGPDETVRIVKDVAAGGVLVCAAAAAAIGVATFLPYVASVTLLGGKVP